MTDYTKALKQYDPTAEWDIGDTYRSLNWRKGARPKPTKVQLEAAYKTWVLEKSYAEKRRYLPANKQLEMMYDDLVNGTKTWEEHNKAIKAEFPKRETLR